MYRLRVKSTGTNPSGHFCSLWMGPERSSEHLIGRVFIVNEDIEQLRAGQVQIFFRETTSDAEKINDLSLGGTQEHVPDRILPEGG